MNETSLELQFEQQNKFEARARRENAADLWDRLWSDPKSRDWREVALARVYDRILSYLGKGLQVVDIGGGVGAFAERALREREAQVQVWDHSLAALQQARRKSLAVHQVDLEDHNDTLDAFTFLAEGDDREDAPVFVSTEVLEHLSAKSRDRLLQHICCYTDDVHAFFTVPNNRLGPEVEPQHTIQFTAITFREELRPYFDHVRVEVLGPYLLAVCGPAAKVSCPVSMCLPVRDEEADLEAVLASFRGFVDEIVVGIDPRTTDRTPEIAAAYADLVFELEDPACLDPENPLHDPAVPPEGVHFAWVRNQCIERCTSPWVFMTEGHERLWQGGDLLLGVGELLADADVAYVWRRGVGQRWLFPWLARHSIRYKRSTHNVIDMPEGARTALMRGVVTFHDRDHGNAVKRAKQRRHQNRKTLWDDWVLHGNPSSLFYFAQELREDDPLQAIERFEEFLQEAPPEAGAMRYQARLILAKLYLQMAREHDRDGDPDAAKLNRYRCTTILHGCTAEDWGRTEHWLWLGDLAFNAEQFEQAYRFYGYCALAAGRLPSSVWWLDEATYLWLAPQRLAMTAGHLGREHEALIWCERVIDLLPPDAPEETFEECRRNADIIREVIAERDLTA